MSHLYTKLIGEALNPDLVVRFPEIKKISKYKNVDKYNANWSPVIDNAPHLHAAIDQHLDELLRAHDTLTQLGVTERVLYVTVTESLQGNFELSEEQVQKLASLNAALAVTVVYRKA
ncbi:hypothetical protein GGR28_001282 [Lewinella aquimaris]|uniref:DUF4279 domain-containing protein n=1 Tax=Neolewinella aquimaris TaxID=1835722 RepID=A0A840EA29_9BACT|nr:hypothetical protein [Neolewinella aquimaris]MBB4078669.1 hypothetical protein [Neolewinella aquimaris]